MNELLKSYFSEVVPECVFQGYHPDGCYGCLHALVSVPSTSPVERLLLVEHGEQSENMGFSGLDTQLG
jgi:hypothetical protein